MSESSKKDTKEKPAHIRDLFSTGKLITVDAVDSSVGDVEFEVWVRKPTPEAMKEIQDKAAAAAARVKARRRDPDDPRIISLKEEVRDLDRDEAIEFLMAGFESELKEQAYNAVLWSDQVGSDWSADGKDYLNTILASAERLLEIEKYNQSLATEDIHLRTKPEDDEDLQALEALETEFNDEVQEHLDKLIKKEKLKHKNKTVDVLRSECINLVLKTDIEIARHQRYLLEEILYCCRYPEDKSQHYFKSIDEIEGLPQSILGQLLAGIKDVMTGSTDIKNLLSLLPS